MTKQERKDLEKDYEGEIKLLKKGIKDFQNRIKVLEKKIWDSPTTTYRIVAMQGGFKVYITNKTYEIDIIKEVFNLRDLWDILDKTSKSSSILLQINKIDVLQINVNDYRTSNGAIYRIFDEFWEMQTIKEK